MSDVAITFVVIGIMVVLFISNLVPVGIAALGAALALYGAGVLDLQEALHGFGDPLVLFITSLLVVGAALDATGVTAWAGQALMGWAGQSQTRLLVFSMLVVAALTAFVGISAAVASMLPVLVLVAVRVRASPSRLLMPLVFAGNAGSTLLLTGSLANLIASEAATEQGLPGFGYFELTPVGVTLLAGTVAIVTLLGERLLPNRSSRTLPADLSGHPGVLAQQYELLQDVHPLVLPPGSPSIGMPRAHFGMADYPGLRLLAVHPKRLTAPPSRLRLAVGDTLLVRGDADTVSRFAKDRGLIAQGRPTAAEIREALFNNTEGFAEVVIPPRSGLIGQAMFPGMITPSGDLIVLAIQRAGEAIGPGETVLAAGDTLLLQGSWKALEEHLNDPDVRVIDRPEMVRRQAMPMGRGAGRAIAVLGAMALLLAFGAVPPAVAGLLAAGAMVLLGVISLEHAYRSINWTAVILVASLIPLSTAMYKTGAAAWMAHALVVRVGDATPYALLAGLFVLTAILCQLISSAATALIVIPVAVVAANAISISPRTALVTVIVASSASFLTPIASAANMMVQAPGGYRFGDYWKLGLPLLAWFFLIGTVLVPLLWPFAGRLAH
jgi:di/tricarboxylate transporter